MAQFATSTQQACWLVSCETVNARRRCAIVEARPAETSFSVEEEAIVRRHHERRIFRFVSRIGFPDKVAATAITYFKRFYLDRSVLDYNPSVIALSCLYASMKIEEVILSADDLVLRIDTVLNGICDPDANPAGEAATQSVDATASRVTADMLLNEELPFFNMLKFHLICYHPYRSLSVLRVRVSEDGDLPDLTERTPSGEAAGESVGLQAKEYTLLEKLFGLAVRIVNRRILLTDMPLTLSPAAIAIAAVVVSACELAEMERVGGVDPELISQKLLSGMDVHVVGTIKSAIAEVKAMREGGLAPDEKVRELESRRKVLCKQENDPTSDVYKKLQLEKERELDRKRLKQDREMTALKEARAQSILTGN